MDADAKTSMPDKEAKRSLVAEAPSALDFNRRALDAIGLWPASSECSRRGRHWRRVLPVAMLVRMACIVAVEVMSIAHAWGDTTMTVEFTIMVLFYTHIAVKYSCLYLRRERLRHVLARVDALTLDLAAVHPTNAAILRKSDLVCYRVNRYPTGGSVVLIAIPLFALLIRSLSTQEIPFFLWFPYDSQVSPAHEATLVGMFLNILLDLTVIVICDAAIVITILLLAGQLRMLSNDIEHAKSIAEHYSRNAKRSLLASRNDPNTRPTAALASQQNGCLSQFFGQAISRPLRSEAAEKMVGAMRMTLSMGRMDGIMKTNVKHHQQIISLSREIQVLFGVMLAEQLVFNGMMGLVAMYVGSLSRTTFEKSVLMSSAIVGSLVELFFICWSCDMLTVQSGRVFEAAYSCDWLDESAAFKRTLRLLMTRAHKDIAVKAAGISVSRRTFRTVCKAAYYFHFLLKRIYAHS